MKVIGRQIIHPARREHEKTDTPTLLSDRVVIDTKSIVNDKQVFHNDKRIILSARQNVKVLNKRASKYKKQKQA